MSLGVLLNYGRFPLHIILGDCCGVLVWDRGLGPSSTRLRVYTAHRLPRKSVLNAYGLHIPPTNTALRCLAMQSTDSGASTSERKNN